MDFPKRRSETANTQTNEGQRKESNVQGRVFALIKKDAEVSNNVVSSTLPYSLEKPKFFLTLVLHIHLYLVCLPVVLMCRSHH